MPFRKLFLSRWSALLWAAGIVWTAVDTVGFAPAHKSGTASARTTPAEPTDASPTPEDVANMANLINAL